MIDSFGQLPKGERLRRIKSSNNFREGSFHNLERTEMLAPGASYPKMIRQFFFSDNTGKEPQGILPAVKPQWESVRSSVPSITWFGHSSYLLSLEGKNILVDPVFGERASPFTFIGSKAFKTTYKFQTSDLPQIDLLILTHDHYDHLDHATIRKLLVKVPKIATSLGVGAHLEGWGADASTIVEFDWWDSHELIQGFRLTAAPARHFSGRLFNRNQSLWSAFLLEVNGMKIYVGGDSGYDKSFTKAGDAFGPIDLAILECGQYDKQWPYIHMMPEETVQAAADLKAKVLLPVHWGKFKLANHAWTDPIRRAVAHASKLGQPIVTPKIGATTAIGTIGGERWWEGLVDS